jgi:hypothetical protein
MITGCGCPAGGTGVVARTPEAALSRWIASGLGLGGPWLSAPGRAVALGGTSSICPLPPRRTSGTGPPLDGSSCAAPGAMSDDHSAAAIAASKIHRGTPGASIRTMPSLRSQTAVPMHNSMLLGKKPPRLIISPAPIHALPGLGARGCNPA